MEATRGAGPEGPAPRPAIVAPEARFEDRDRGGSADIESIEFHAP